VQRSISAAAKQRRFSHTGHAAAQGATAATAAAGDAAAIAKNQPYQVSVGVKFAKNDATSPGGVAANGPSSLGAPPTIDEESNITSNGNGSTSLSKQPSLKLSLKSSPVAGSN